MNRLKSTLIIASTALLAFAGAAIGQGQGLFGPFPVIGGSSYCAAYGNNNTCTSTVPAGPVALTGNETILVNTNLSQGRSPQNALVTPATLNANPIYFAPTITTTTPSISASNISGGVVFTSATTITSANITLPANASQNQQYQISSNRTITTLSVTAASGDSMATNTTPTALTASTTAPNGYTFICDKAGGSTCTWHRLR